MEAPIYHLEGVVKAKEENMEDFVGPLDLILHLLSKNKMEVQGHSDIADPGPVSGMDEQAEGIGLGGGQ